MGLAVQVARLAIVQCRVSSGVPNPRSVAKMCKALQPLLQQFNGAAKPGTAPNAQQGS